MKAIKTKTRPNNIVKPGSFNVPGAAKNDGKMPNIKPTIRKTGL